MSNRIVIWLMLMAALAVQAPAQTPGPAAGAAQSAEQPASAGAARELDDLVAKGMRATQPLAAAELQRALELAAALGRPHMVEPLIKTYLVHDSNPPAALMRLAAENARMRGDWRLAIARQKVYVRGLPAGVEASEGAAVLYRMLTDMGAKEEAYVFMKEYGETLRASVNARKFDAWFLQAAWERGDLASAARWLAACMGDQAPLELERLLYGGDVTRLIDATRRDNPKAYEAVPHMRRIVAQLRESPALRAQLQFQADYQLFCAGAAARDKEALAKDFAASAASAKAWLDAAPTARTLAAICDTWSNGGGDNWQTQWGRAVDAKHAFFKESFARLPDAEKAAFFQQDPVGRILPVLLPADAWLDLIRQTPPGPARNGWAALVPLPWDSKDPALHRAAAPALDGIWNERAAVMRALATGDDVNGAVQHLAGKETWHLSGGDALDRMLDDMLRVFQQFPRGDAQKLSKDAVEQARARYARDVFFVSPLALLNHGAARGYMNLLWDLGDRAKAVETLRLLDWAPLSEDERRQTYEDVEKRYREWGEQVRRSRQEAAKKSPEEAAKFDAQVALIDPIGQALKQVKDPAVYDPNKAPNPLCQQMARLRDATRRKDREAALAAARAAYALLRDCEAGQLPFGRMCLAEVLRPRAEVNLADLGFEVFADQLGLYAQTGRRTGLDMAVGLLSGSKGWNDGSLQRAEGADRMKLEAATSKAVRAMLAAGKFDALLFDLYRQTRPQDNDASREIMTKLIEGKVLVGQPGFNVPGAPRASAATKYQWLIEREFPWMNEKYPRDRYFDDLFAEEVTRTRQIDLRFWERSPDTQRKGGNAACAVLKGFEKLPFGYDGGAPAYDREEFYAICWNAVTHADEAPRREMLAAAEAAFGKTRFDNYAIGCVGLQLTAPPDNPEARKAFFDRLGAMLDRASALPRLVEAPDLTATVEALVKGGKLSDAEVSVLRRMFMEMRFAWSAGMLAATGSEQIRASLLAQGRTAELLSVLPAFWVAARSLEMGPRLTVYGKLVAGAVAFTDSGLLDLAATSAMAGLTLGEQLSNESRRTLEEIRSKALVKVGGAIPVDKNDRRYPVYAAQLAYLSGVEEEAWTAAYGCRELLLAEIRNLDWMFLLWLIEKATDRGEFDFADQLSQTMIDAAEASAGQMADSENRARLFMAQADVTLARQDYPLAKSLYERVALNKDFEGTKARLRAEVKVADVERLTRDYKGATQRLEGLLSREEPYLQTQANYVMALVKYDQEEYKEAREYLNQAMLLDPALPDAVILNGKLNLKLKKLVEATKVQVGITSSQRVLIPGRPLSVQVEDRNLSVVGASMGIEVRAWTTSGDEETFILMPFGDSKTRFEGQITTALGAAVKGNRNLEVLGGDDVSYDFSERFKQVNKVASAAAPPVKVKADSELFASSGVILSREEMAEIELERQIRGRVGEAAPQEGVGVTVNTLSNRRALDQVKPGNPIRVRVVAPGRSVTVGRNTVNLRAVSSSGDSVELSVRETDVCSGIFDGELKTAFAPAKAFASDSNEGADPDFVVSAGDYPPWVGMPDGNRPKTFGVDMNDNIAVKTLAVQADVPARRLKHFLVQTSMNASQYRTVGSWPAPPPSWDGALQMTVMRLPPHIQAQWQQQKPAERVGLLADCFEIGGNPSMPAPVTMPGALSLNLGSQIIGLQERLGLSHDRRDPNSWYAIRLRGGFYLRQRAERTFRPKVTGTDNYALVVDGKLAIKGKHSEVEEVTQSYGKGVHTVEFYLLAQRGVEVTYAIECDIKEPPYFAVCPADMFDVVRNPQIPAALRFTPATVTAHPENNGFDVAFVTNTQARALRMVILDFEGDAPAIRRMKLVDASGRTLLPTKEDLLALRKNDVLEAMPGDAIRITHENPAPVTPERRVQEASLSVTYHNAGMGAYFQDVRDDSQGRRVVRYVRMRRFRIGDPIEIIVTDPDCDVSDKADLLKLTVRSTSGATLAVDALEDDPRGGPTVHTGVFLAKIFTVEGAPKRPAELPLAPGDDVEITYRDMENTDFGIPWDRTVLVEQAGADDPVLRMFDITSTQVGEDAGPAGAAGKGAPTVPDRGFWQMRGIEDELIPKRRVLGVMRRDTVDDTTAATGMVVCPVLVEVTWPSIALSPLSRVTMYAQTTSSRRLAGVTDDAVFDPGVPGTLELVGGPGDVGGLSVPPGYKSVVVRRSQAAEAVARGDALDEGRFAFAIPLRLGVANTLTPEEAGLKGEAGTTLKAGLNPDEVPPGVLGIRPGDDVVIGFGAQPVGTNADAMAAGGNVSATSSNRWIVRRVKVLGDLQAFDVMDKQYKTPVRYIYMGERVYLRAIDPMADTTDGRDECNIQVRAGDAAPVSIPLQETSLHSGVFKGILHIVAAEEASPTNMAPGTLAAKYGDTVTLTCRGGNPVGTIERSFRVSMGSDGTVDGFTKRFKDPAIAVQTQFTVAEAYFELAKNHRQLKQEELSRREIAQGRKLLEEAIRDFPQTDARAQAEYLLAELSLELAQDEKDEAKKKKHAADALQRFIEICATYPDSAYAPKAQFKKGITLERMGQIDEACEEYVRLSYKYPDHELVAETIARLGQYFLGKGKKFETEIATVTDPVKKEKVRLQSVDMFRTAAQVFSRLAKRFPDHKLASKTTVLAGQCYMRAGDYDRAVATLRGVIDGKRAEADLTAEAMYWCGDSFMKMATSVAGRKGAVVDAYRMFKRLTWDYPESQWAKYARGRLTEPALATVDAAGGG